MSVTYQHEIQALAQLGGNPGFWRLGAGRAITLMPKGRGELRVAQGRVWVTVDQPSGADVALAGDHVLEAGGLLQVPAGARVVMEAWPRPHDPPVFFNWVPQAATAKAPAAGVSRWCADVVRPARDLGHALLAAALALGRLGLGLASYGEFLVAGRGRVLSRFESNPP